MKERKINMYKYNVNFELIKCMHNLLRIQNYFKIILLITAGCLYLMKMYIIFRSHCLKLCSSKYYNEANMTKCFKVHHFIDLILFK